MKKLKKFLYNSLCNNLTGKIIRVVYKNAIPDIRWKGYVYLIDPRFVKNEIIAALYFGFYEKAEIKLVEKYVKNDLSVIEFGASLGVVSSHVAKKLKAPYKFIMVEANPYLIPLINSNIKEYLSDGIQHHIINKAIAYHSQEVNLNITDNNTSNSIATEEDRKATSVRVKTVTLSSLIDQFKLEEYALICDIEGAEIEWLVYENTCLYNCKQLIIELHETYYGKKYSVSDLKEIIMTKHNFKLIENNGPVCYFEK